MADTITSTDDLKKLLDSPDITDETKRQLLLSTLANGNEKSDNSGTVIDGFNASDFDDYKKKLNISDNEIADYSFNDGKSYQDQVTAAQKEETDNKAQSKTVKDNLSTLGDMQKKADGGEFGGAGTDNSNKIMDLAMPAMQRFKDYLPIWARLNGVPKDGEKNQAVKDIDEAWRHFDEQRDITFDKFEDEATALKTAADNTTGNNTDMDSALSGLFSHWTGDAANGAQKTFEKFKQDSDDNVIKHLTGTSDAIKVMSKAVAQAVRDKVNTILKCLHADDPNNSNGKLSGKTVDDWTVTVDIANGSTDMDTLKKGAEVWGVDTDANNCSGDLDDSSKASIVAKAKQVVKDIMITSIADDWQHFMDACDAARKQTNAAYDALMKVPDGYPKDGAVFPGPDAPSGGGGTGGSQPPPGGSGDQPPPGGPGDQPPPGGPGSQPPPGGPGDSGSQPPPPGGTDIGKNQGVDLSKVGQDQPPGTDPSSLNQPPGGSGGGPGDAGSGGGPGDSAGGSGSGGSDGSGGSGPGGAGPSGSGGSGSGGSGSGSGGAGKPPPTPKMPDLSHIGEGMAPSSAGGAGLPDGSGPGGSGSGGPGGGGDQTSPSSAGGSDPGGSAPGGAGPGGSGSGGSGSGSGGAGKPPPTPKMPDLSHIGEGLAPSSGGAVPGGGTGGTGGTGGPNGHGGPGSGQPRPNLTKKVQLPGGANATVSKPDVHGNEMLTIHEPNGTTKQFELAFDGKHGTHVPPGVPTLHPDAHGQMVIHDGNHTLTVGKPGADGSSPVTVQGPDGAKHTFHVVSPETKLPAAEPALPGPLFGTALGGGPGGGTDASAVSDALNGIGGGNGGGDSGGSGGAAEHALPGSASTPGSAGSPPSQGGSSGAGLQPGPGQVGSPTVAAGGGRPGPAGGPGGAPGGAPGGGMGMGGMPGGGGNGGGGGGGDTDRKSRWATAGDLFDDLSTKRADRLQSFLESTPAERKE